MLITGQGGVEYVEIHYHGTGGKHRKRLPGGDWLVHRQGPGVFVWYGGFMGSLDVIGSRKNIVLIGMAGAGKSTVGPELARMLERPFLDVDQVMELERGMALQQILEREGRAGFRAFEEQILLGLALRGHVIATGGSAVYSWAGMEHLRASSCLVLLDVELGELEARVSNIATRGLVRQDEQSFASLYREREPLYRQYAHWSIDCSGKSLTSICHSIVARMAEGCS